MAGTEEAQEAVERLRETDPERWATLCRMHLSFLLDLKNDDFEAVFGANPSDLRSSRKTLVPFVRRHKDKGFSDRSLLTQETLQQAHRLIRHLNRNENLRHEGLFRKTGKLSRQHDLKTLLHSGLPLNLEGGDYSVHDCASLLKNFLADLPEPLLTEAHYPAHCQIPDLCPEHLEGSLRETAVKRQVQSLQLLFQLLPSENCSLLQALLNMLNRVAQHEHQNRMDPLNLGTVFAPHILCPRKMTAVDMQTRFSHMTKAVALMVQHAADLFDVPDNVAHDALMYWKKMQQQKACSVENVKDAEDKADDIDEVNTCITFCDRDLTSRVDTSSTTALALAELYAYIQTMPDSDAKNKYVKRIGKENGASSPCIPTNKNGRSRSLGMSIKKHFFRNRKQTPSQMDNVPDKSLEDTGWKNDRSISASLSASLGDGLERRQACLAPSYLRSADISELPPLLSSATSLPDSLESSPVSRPTLADTSPLVTLADSPGVSRRRKSREVSAISSHWANTADESTRKVDISAEMLNTTEKSKAARAWPWESPRAWMASWLNQNSKMAGKVESVLCSCKPPTAKTKTPTLTLYRRLNVDPIPIKLSVEKKLSAELSKNSKPPVALVRKVSVSPLRQIAVTRQSRLLLRSCRSNSAAILNVPRSPAVPVVGRSYSLTEVGTSVVKETCV